MSADNGYDIDSAEAKQVLLQGMTVTMAVMTNERPN